MKAGILILLVIAIGIIYCQIDPNTAINSCGKIGYNQPATSEECKPGGEKNLCCYVEIPNKKIKYCAFMPNTKLEDDVVNEFKKIINESDIKVVCNSSTTIVLNLFFTLFALFSLLFS